MSTARRPALEPGVGPPRPQQRFLHGVLGVVHRAEHPVAMREQLAAVRLDEAGELLVADRHDGSLDHSHVNADPARQRNSSPIVDEPAYAALSCPVEWRLIGRVASYKSPLDAQVATQRDGRALQPLRWAR